MIKPAWIVMGPLENWRVAFQQGGIWGVKPLVYPEWKAMDPGDQIFFFVTKTVKGIVGAGRVETKFVQDKPLWPDEIQVGKIIYPYRFEFHIDYLLEENRWYKDRVSSRDVPLTIQEMRRGINFLQAQTYEKLIRVFMNRFSFDLSIKQEKEEKKIEVNEKEISSPDHKSVQEMIFQIGKLNRLIAEKEYAMENERLDVVWRRVEKSVPTYVFEVQIGGDVYHALGKLKHAYDLWNSNIFIIAGEQHNEEIKDLLEGTFHEIRHKIRLISLKTMNELFLQKRKWVELEKEVGLL